MSPKEKAKELVEKFIPNVYCYLGSGMLTNKYSEEVALINAKKQALICVNEIIRQNPNLPNEYSCTKSYWQEVKQEIENCESADN